MRDYEGTIFVEPKNSNQIVDNILTIFKDRKMTKGYESHLIWEDVVRKYIDMINWLRGD